MTSYSLGGSGGMPPRNILCSDTASGAIIAIEFLKNPPDRALECIKRSTRMYKNVHYYNLLDQ